MSDCPPGCHVKFNIYWYLSCLSQSLGVYRGDHRLHPNSQLESVTRTSRHSQTHKFSLNLPQVIKTYSSFFYQRLILHRVPRKLKGEVFSYNWIKWWNFHSFNIWILSNNFLVVKGRAKFSVLLQIRFWWIFPSQVNLDICTVSYTTETEAIQ